MNELVSTKQRCTLCTNNNFGAKEQPNAATGGTYPSISPQPRPTRPNPDPTHSLAVVGPIACLSPSPSPQKKRALGDRTNNSATEAAPAGKAGIIAAGTPGVQPAAAAERRAASRALIDGESAINDESAGECNQS